MKYLKGLWAILKSIVLRKRLASTGTISVRHMICVNCPLGALKPSLVWEDAQKCDVCKCNISRERSHFNKLAHQDQACPAGYWQTVNESNVPAIPLKERILNACCRM